MNQCQVYDAISVQDKVYNMKRLAKEILCGMLSLK